MAQPIPPGAFPIHPISAFERPFPYFSQPVELGHFSLDENRTYHSDARNLRVYAPPRDPRNTYINLRQGYNTYITEDPGTCEKMDRLSTWILQNKQLIAVEAGNTTDGSGRHPSQTSENGMPMKRIKADFVTRRGHLVKFLSTPYDQEGWAMTVTLFRGTYYISEIQTEEHRRRRERETEREEMMTYWGHKFEQCVTSEDGISPPDTSTPVNDNVRFYTITRTNLESHSLLYSAEVDCRLSSSQQPPPGNYIELKTTRIWDGPNSERNFCRRKLRHCWEQSFLIGIPEIVFGFRDDNGIVRHLKSFKTAEMPNKSMGFWNGSVSFNFIDQLLAYIKENVTVDDPTAVYMLERRPKSSHITCRRLSNLEISRSSLQILNSEYIAAFEEVRKTASTPA